MKTMLITGASSGIGAATARRAVEAGYRVGLAARRKEKLDGLVDELGPDNALAVGCDVTDFASQQTAVAAVIERFGGLNALFANAGVGATGSGTAGGDPAEWRQMVLTNVLGVMYSVKAAYEAIAAARGHILITSSGAGRKVIPGSVYGATKWAMSGYGANLREEMREKGVKVTLIEPGMVDTPFFDEPKPGALVADDIARAVIYALSQPENVLAGEIWVEPLRR
ncbi:SDR family oxidoreductase [Aurantimonas sp. 22II-16-19i]|uniref:SDR family oxidoreductase n=1 Tax=Aurantimonas sp. 22II-16-19i TaxID=1317114 RepID=UPI0009F7B18B|nr:SDR family oxidoreductase [Aurantimonas sp. 22II-16-19i]ORE92799.1 short chain dehydrogenase/reductase family oxidoreductase [Aurantimonas sp. 22II-16-19i]